MKKIILALLFSLVLNLINAQSLQGAWESNTKINNANVTLKNVTIFSSDHWSTAVFDSNTGFFYTTKGGNYKLDGNTLTQNIEFDSSNTDAVGKTVTTQITITAASFAVMGSDLKYTRIDDGSPGDLAGAWLISGRKRDGEIQSRDTNRPRKTMKILSGTRFQWIAYNTETKEFLGSGGGTYITANGKYTEEIGFFSRDNSRVGASLQFDYKLENGDWHHSGLSSKGQPIYEIWSLR